MTLNFIGGETSGPESSLSESDSSDPDQPSLEDDKLEIAYIKSLELKIQQLENYRQIGMLKEASPSSDPEQQEYRYQGILEA